MAGRKRYAQVGLGSRSGMYSGAVVEKYGEYAELVGLSDSNEGRLNQRMGWARSAGADPKGYMAADFEKMIKETKADTVLVMTKDCHHDEYIVKALEMGCDAITEKPMTTDAGKCQRIIDTQKKTGKKVTVTFNYRYSPPRTQIKDLLMNGVVGNVVSVDFHWLLNTRHGADYFRRWHRNKANSGGLLVHKATHHFDLVNWWLSSVPENVYAYGARNFYTPETAERYGLSKRSERCLDCPEKDKCNFHLDLAASEGLKKLYLENEQYDGYFRDRCVFSDLIDIEDTMHLVVKYMSGASMSYSLHSFMPWEGYVIAFNGTKGRLEHKCMETVYISGDGNTPGELLPEGTTTRIYPHFLPGREEEVWTGAGGHGGGDDPLLDDLFHPNPPEDRYMRAADQRGGAYSILTGVAANKSIAGGEVVRINDLVSGLELPDYPPMPAPDEALPMPKAGSLSH
ncbi:MAG: Gfo/Idh/MocA family oxidoreductase [Planctomycetes bacterium]|nr:Gfo/Idh/MocA family oxidoreductase [Planctomycetota bacterium]